MCQLTMVADTRNRFRTMESGGVGNSDICRIFASLEQDVAGIGARDTVWSNVAKQRTASSSSLRHAMHGVLADLHAFRDMFLILI